jgi:hypothetical protein
MNANDILRPLSDDLEFETLRFPGEDVLREQIARRPAAVETIRRWCSLDACPVVPRSLHRQAFIASPAAAPGLAQLARMLETILGLEVRPEIVVFPSPDWFVVADHAQATKPYRVIVSSAVFERVGVREAMFQIGRRLAWRLFDHVPLLGNPTVGTAKPDHDALLIRGLWKFQELTCDRIGLLCCQDAELAARSVLRFASGLPDELLVVDWEALLAERIPEEEAMLADSPYQFALLRAAALRQFATGDRYAACFVPALKSLAPPADRPMPLPMESVEEALVVEAEPPTTDDESIPAPAVEQEVEVSETPGVEARFLESQTTDSFQHGESVLSAAAASPTRSSYAVEEAPRTFDPGLEDVKEGMVDQPSQRPSPGGREKSPLAGRGADDCDAPEPDRLASSPSSGGDDESEPIISVTEPSTTAQQAEALRQFTLWGVLWVIGVDAPVPEPARAEMWETFGSEAAAAIDEAENPDGDERCARQCATAAPIAAGAPFERRRGTIEDVIDLALSAGPIGVRERERLADLTELLDLSMDDLEAAAGEMIEPEYSDFAFLEGQDVEAMIEGEWTPGVVHSLDPESGVRVFFPRLARTIWMSPATDQLRRADEAEVERLA